MLSIQISQQFAKLGIDSSRPNLELQQPPADLQIEQPAAIIEIHQGPGKLEMDSSAGNASLGHRSNQRFLESIAAQSRQHALEVVGQIASEGNELAKIKGASFADLARSHQQQGAMQMSYAGPFTAPYVDIQFTPRPVEIDVTPQKPIIEITPQKADVTYTPGAVHAYVAQQNSLHVDVTGQYMNMQF